MLRRSVIMTGISSILAFNAMAMTGSGTGSPGAPISTLEQGEIIPASSRSSTIALSSDDRRVVVVNREQNSVSVIEVQDEQGNDTSNLIAEVSVGNEPRYVALSPNDRWALVSNAVDGTVSLIALAGGTPAVLGEPITVGTEPRGIAFTPNGALAFVANHSSGNVSVIDTQQWEVINTIATGGNPLAIAVTNDGDDEDNDEQVYVTRFFGEVIDPARPDGFDDAKQGVIDNFGVKDAWQGVTRVRQITLSPLTDSGFNADRRQFCQKTRDILQDNGEVVFFNSAADGQGNGAAALANEVFCPDNQSSDASTDGPIGSTPQGAYSNLLHGALIRNGRLYIPHIGDQPEPPVRFNVNVQALVGVVDLRRGEHVESVNINAQIAQETQPDDPTRSLDRLFGNDIVAMDADRNGEHFFIVSRGGNYVLRAGLDAQGTITIFSGQGTGAIRYQTGNLPSGVVVNASATRLYTNNEANSSVTAVDLVSNQVIERDIHASTPAVPGTDEHRILIGKLVFHTALGIPDVLDTNGDGSFDIDVRDIEPLRFRNKASDNAWSSCASCHEDGHSDGVTWLFPTGPRQTIALEGSFAKNDLSDQRIFNWNAVRGSNTDFDQNSRGVQGGIGHATDVNGENRSAQIFNHGPVEGISDALDALSEWVASVRAPVMPDGEDSEAGRRVFAEHCASCHGGVKWTKSRTSPLYDNNPIFAENPIGANFFAGVAPLDPRLTVAGPQIVSVTDEQAGTLRFLDDVGTVDAGNPLEIRGAGAIAGQSTQGFPSLSANGAFNSPSLLGLGLSAPFLHDGSALSLEEVFIRHRLGEASIAQTLDSSDRQALVDFLVSIDDDTEPFASDADRFLDALR